MILLSKSMLKKTLKELQKKNTHLTKNQVNDIFFKTLYPKIKNFESTVDFNDSGGLVEFYYEIYKVINKESIKNLKELKTEYQLNLKEMIENYNLSKTALLSSGLQLDTLYYYEKSLSFKIVQLKKFDMPYLLSDYLKLSLIINDTYEFTEFEKLNEINFSIFLNKLIDKLKIKLKKYESIEKVNKIEFRELYYYRKMKKEKIIYKEGLIIEHILKESSIDQIIEDFTQILSEERALKLEIFFHEISYNSFNPTFKNNVKNLKKEYKLVDKIKKSLKHSNTLITGGTGTGKSFLMNRLFNKDIKENRAIIIFEPTVQLTIIENENYENVFHSNIDYLEDNQIKFKNHINTNKLIYIEFNNRKVGSNYKHVFEEILDSSNHQNLSIYFDEDYNFIKDNINYINQLFLNKDIKIFIASQSTPLKSIKEFLELYDFNLIISKSQNDFGNTQLSKTIERLIKYQFILTDNHEVLTNDKITSKKFKSIKLEANNITSIYNSYRYYHYVHYRNPLI